MPHSLVQPLRRYNAQELVNLLWCHAALGVQPPLGFLEAATAALGRRMQSCDASLVALVVHSMAILRYGAMTLVRTSNCGCALGGNTVIAVWTRQGTAQHSTAACSCVRFWSLTLLPHWMACTSIKKPVFFSTCVLPAMPLDIHEEGSVCEASKDALYMEGRAYTPSPAAGMLHLMTGLKRRFSAWQRQCRKAWMTTQQA